MTTATYLLWIPSRPATYPRGYLSSNTRVQVQNIVVYLSKSRLSNMSSEKLNSVSISTAAPSEQPQSLSPSEPRNRTGVVKPEVLLNKDGQRIDCNLLHVLRSDLTDADKRMRSKAPRPCSIHYVFGQGTCSAVQCQHSHTERIPAGEILAMALRAREVPCSMGESLIKFVYPLLPVTDFSHNRRTDTEGV